MSVAIRSISSHEHFATHCVISLLFSQSDKAIVVG